MASSSKSKTIKKQSGLGLTAAALQDHLIKSCGLDLNQGIRNSSKLNKTPKKRCEVKQKQTNSHTRPLPKKEYVIGEEKMKQNLSLAERMGIVESPLDNVISETQWLDLKKRCRKRGELTEACSICKELYSSRREQVLLSCSHIFHRSCVASFEKFSRQKSCPICRCKNYQARVIHDGTLLTAHMCATKIQSHWRRYVMQKEYEAIREVVPPQDVNLRKKFYEGKLLTICEKVSKCYEDHNDNVSQLLIKIDENITSNRNVMSKWSDSLVDEQLDWESVEHSASRREVDDCPICLCNFHSVRKQVVLLSCTHVFHSQCLTSYEKFTHKVSPMCPVCRAAYSKRHVPVYSS